MLMLVGYRVLVKVAGSVGDAELDALPHEAIHPAVRKGVAPAMAARSVRAGRGMGEQRR